MIWKVKTAMIFLNYEVLADLSLVTENISSYIGCLPKMKDNNVGFLQNKTKTM